MDEIIHSQIYSLRFFAMAVESTNYGADVESDDVYIVLICFGEKRSFTLLNSRSLAIALHENFTSLSPSWDANVVSRIHYTKPGLCSFYTVREQLLNRYIHISQKGDS